MVLEQREKDVQMYTSLMNDVKSRMAEGRLPDCFAKHLLDEQKGLGMTDLEVAYTAGTPFGAGVETVCCYLGTSPPFPLKTNQTKQTTVRRILGVVHACLCQIRAFVHPKSPS